MKTHYQVFDTKARMAVAGCEAMIIICNAQDVAQRLNRRYKNPRYVVRLVDPDRLPLCGQEPDAADIVSEFS